LSVLVFIQKHLDEELSLEEYARVAHFSPYHFHRIFRGMVGESLAEHMRRLRLERAATRLKRTDRSIIEIALEAGYETHEAFTRAFRALCGCSPSRYRRDTSVIPALGPNGVHYRENGSLDDLQLPIGGEAMEVRIERVNPMLVAFVRHVGPYDGVSAAWERLCMRLGKEGLLGPGTQFIGVCHDDPEARTIATMKAFAERQGLTFHGRHHEIYLSDPRRIAPEKLRTILRIPVRKMESCRP
jgi:AraC family transcriptional regulator